MNIGHLIILVLTGLFFLSFFRKHLWRLNATEAATRNNSGDILKQQRLKFQTTVPRFKTKAPRFKTTAPEIQHNGELSRFKTIPPRFNTTAPIIQHNSNRDSRKQQQRFAETAAD